MKKKTTTTRFLLEIIQNMMIGVPPTQKEVERLTRITANTIRKERGLPIHKVN